MNDERDVAADVELSHPPQADQVLAETNPGADRRLEPARAGATQKEGETGKTQEPERPPAEGRQRERDDGTGCDGKTECRESGGTGGTADSQPW